MEKEIAHAISGRFGSNMKMAHGMVWGFIVNEYSKIVMLNTKGNELVGYAFVVHVRFLENRIDALSASVDLGKANGRVSELIMKRVCVCVCVSF